jgi:hypothetical protein
MTICARLAVDKCVIDNCSKPKLDGDGIPICHSHWVRFCAHQRDQRQANLPALTLRGWLQTYWIEDVQTCAECGAMWGGKADYLCKECRA